MEQSLYNSKSEHNNAFNRLNNLNILVNILCIKYFKVSYMNIKLIHTKCLVFPLSILLLVYTTHVLAQPELTLESNEDSREWIWNLLIALIAVVFTLASAALPLAAMRQWKGGWSLAAAFPLGILLIWIAIISIAKLQSLESHKLWPFEVFAWAMLNMVYMVSVMTIKRILEKQPNKKAGYD